jgi:hypothetical protein
VRWLKSVFCSFSALARFISTFFCSWKSDSSVITNMESHCVNDFFNLSELHESFFFWMSWKGCKLNWWIEWIVVTSQMVRKLNSINWNGLGRESFWISNMNLHLIKLQLQLCGLYSQISWEWTSKLCVENWYQFKQFRWKAALFNDSDSNSYW